MSHDRREPAPRAELHQLDSDTLIGIAAFAAVGLVAVVLAVRAHPWAAGAAVVTLAAGLGGTLVMRARWRDWRASAADPPGPGVIIGHVRGDWRSARDRPFRLPWATFRQHVLIAGPTGRGKSFTFVEPLLRAQQSRPGTGIFYLDGKGDPIDERVAFDAVFCPERPEQSACWNPLAGEDPVQAASLLAAGLFPEAVAIDAPGAFYAARAVYAITRVAPAMAFTGFGTGQKARAPEPIDDQAARQDLVDRGVDPAVAAKLLRQAGTAAVAAQLAWVAHRDEAKQSPDRLVEAIRRQWTVPPDAPALYELNVAQLSRVLFAPKQLEALAERVTAVANRDDIPARTRTLTQLRRDLDGLIALPDRERAAVLQSLQNRLSWFLEPPFLDLCSQSDATIADVTQGARIAFLLPTGRFPNVARPLGRVALSQFKNAVLASEGDREKVAVLDEFHNFVGPDFAPFLNQARSRGGAAIMALQSLADLPRDEADAMLANISTLIVTPGCRPRDSEYFAEAFGKELLPRHAISYEAPSAIELGARPMVRTQLMEDYRFSATEIAELGPGEALIQLTAGRRSWPATRVRVERAHG